MAGTRICGRCARNRKKLEAIKVPKANRGQKMQAKAIDTVLAATEAVGNLFGVTGKDHGEVEDGIRTDQSLEPDSGSTGVTG